MSDKSKIRRARRARAHKRLRQRLAGSVERPRLAVFKSLQYIYAQIIDDGAGVTLAQANSAEGALRKQLETAPRSKAAARLVGETLAARAQEKGITQVVFDRGGYIFHGRIREVAEGARAKGLKF